MMYCILAEVLLYFSQLFSFFFLLFGAKLNVTVVNPLDHSMSSHRSHFHVATSQIKSIENNYNFQTAMSHWLSKESETTEQLYM